MERERALQRAQAILEDINRILLEDPMSIPDLSVYDSPESKSDLSQLVYLLTNISLEYEDSLKLLNETFQLRIKMSHCLNRPVDFRVTLLDILLNNEIRLNNPKMIEIKLYLEQEMQVVVDYLTGLYNKRYFEDALTRELNQTRRYNRNLSVLLIDIDDFKKVNDSYGHAMGDEVLRKLAAIIRENTRKEDTICRTGGEEFTLLLPDTPAKGAWRVGEKIRIAFHKETIASHKLSFSGGVSAYPIDTTDREELIYLADKAMYFSKYSGKNRISIMSDQIRNSDLIGNSNS
ncbi:GGDEF domain-containing protein [Leptospira sp. GIMC2001]|uniref:GGDEF domain-containing protein n=1 Tax=Leptospira sp. GIMC2001 TaxID=1513297 RepID=UPI00234BAED3|nr:GGDEF domain-containing protein [Leptospira sp. GIMC2001]WCL49810.1 GGDEF domain-containing protein [Leptospira sp. GIMC2001]